MTADGRELADCPTCDGEGVIYVDPEPTVCNETWSGARADQCIHPHGHDGSHISVEGYAWLGRLVSYDTEESA
jgi:hypothetical protein